jgi:hypothetical protein
MEFGILSSRSLSGPCPEGCRHLWAVRNPRSFWIHRYPRFTLSFVHGPRDAPWEFPNMMDCRLLLGSELLAAPFLRFSLNTLPDNLRFRAKRLDCNDLT